MRKSVIATALAAAAMAVSACSGDGGTGPAPIIDPRTLSAAEAAQLNQAVLAVSARARQSGTPPVGESTGSMGYGFIQTVSCHAGGTAGLDGDMNIGWSEAAGWARISTDFTVVHKACGHRMENGGVITLTGDPDIDVSLEMATERTGITSFVLRETGAFTWSRDDGNTGRCTLDVSATLNASTRVTTISGTFCGVPVTGSFQGV